VSDQQTQAHEVAPGVISMMRLMVRRAVTTGIILSVCSPLLAVLMFVFNNYALIPVSTSLAVAGPGLISTALAWKAWQAQKE